VKEAGRALTVNRYGPQKLFCAGFFAISAPNEEKREVFEGREPFAYAMHFEKR